MIQYFEGIRIFTLNNRRFNRGSAVTLPGIGIFIGSKQITNIGLLRHEFGHILQRRQKGFLFFWFRIAPVSLVSAFKSSKDKTHTHMQIWTEWTANRASYEYFNQPGDWNFDKYPIELSN